MTNLPLTPPLIEAPNWQSGNRLANVEPALMVLVDKVEAAA